MKSNYNDIIDILMTLLNDEQIQNSIVVTGSIVPFLVTKKESNNYIKDFNILVKLKKMDYVRKKVKKLSKEYEFDIVNDSMDYKVGEYGFKIKYNDTYVRFEPYSFLSNNFKIGSYVIKDETNEIITKTNTLNNITKNCIIRYTDFSNKKKIRILSPEYILVKLELMDKEVFSLDKEVISILKRLSDESILKVVREKIEKQNVDIKKQEAKKDRQLLYILLGAIFVVIVAIILVCVIK